MLFKDTKTAKRSNQSILSPGISLEGMMLKLKLQYFGHLMQRVDSLEKTLMLGGTGGKREGDGRGWDGWMASLTWWMWVWVNSGSWWWTERPGVLRFMGSQRVGHDWATELNWTEVILYVVKKEFHSTVYKSYWRLEGVKEMSSVRTSGGVPTSSHSTRNLSALLS